MNALMLKPSSLLVSAGRDHAPGSPLNRPLVPASNFILGTDRAYSRDDGTPTWEALEEITFATPLNQRPLDLGADFSFQSATKFIGGHSDLLSGVITVRRDDLRTALRHSRELSGATPGALECFLAARGARTMALRLERAQANAMVLAERLHSHRRVALTRYPGLPSHPTHAIARDQLRGFGTIISFDVRGDAAASDRVCSAVRLIRHATSLGAVESTMERRAAIPGQGHLPPSLLRLAVPRRSAPWPVAR